jgi:Chitobiase/beta-hexosaminidase C-terminal domain
MRIEVPQCRAFLAIAIFLAWVTTPAFCQTLFYDFNTAGQFTGNFNLWNDSGGNNAGNYDFAECAACGVNGSGAVNVFQSTDTTATYKSGSWNFSTNGATMVVSALLKANGQANTANKIQLGILNTNANGFYANTGLALESFRFVPSSATTWSLREQYKPASGSTVETTLGSVPNIITGHWYKFTVSLTNSSGTNYSAACALYDFGTDGVTPGTNMITFSTLRINTNQPSLTVASVWPGVRAFQNAGVDAWDNFLVYVPSSKPVFTLAMTNMIFLTNSTPTLRVLADGPGTISCAWFTNGTLANGATGFTYTTPALNSGYTNVTVVASNANGSTTNSAPLSVVAPTLATVTNLPATSVQPTAAILNGQVLNTGNDPPTVTFYYGPVNGGTNPTAWANSISVGTQSGIFSQGIVGLATNTTYYFTAKAVNAAGTSWANPVQSFSTISTNPLISVLTYHYDNTRQGRNTNEFFLTLANVNTKNFGKLFSYSVDGYVYSEPLYVANVTIPAQGTHNVVFVTTENNSVYAFDADSNAGPNGGLLWQTNLGIAQISINNYGVRYHHNVLNPLIGITSTPVIDSVSGTIYIDVFTGPIANTNSGYHVLHALNITDGTEQPYSPVLVAASVPGTGRDSTNGVVTFVPSMHMNHPAMTLANGILYVSYGSYGDTDPYHGWVIGYNATNLTQLTNYTFCTTPNATTNTFGTNAAEGALWMGGGGPCVDANGNIYFEVANGSFSAHTNGGDYGDCFVKLSTAANQLAVADYFAPSNQASMDINDLDLGSGGPIVLPDSVGSTAHPHLVVGAGKEGTIYLVDCDNMGQFNPATNQIVQTLPKVMGGIWGVPAYWNNLIYFQGAGDVLKAFGISNAVMTSAPVTRSTTSFGTFTTPSISANGNNDGIAWVSQVDAYNGANGVTGGPAVLHAYNATNLSQEIYNSNQNLGRDNPGPALKYAVPVVANGKVYVRGEYVLSVFGVNPFPPPPLISPAGGTFTNSVIVTITDSAPSTSIYYTLDGTTPTTNSALYSGPLILTSNTWVQAIAAQSPANISAVSSANFVSATINPPRITGIGLNGTTLNITATNGLPNANCLLLATTNVTLPVIQWTPVLTNRFDGAGNLNLSTNIINPGQSQTFYILQMR